MKKKICVITGTRAEYGLFYPLLTVIKKNKDFELQIIATGMHLSPEFGLTFKEIEKDGFRITRKVKMLLPRNTAESVTKSTGIGIIGIAKALKDIKPDLVILIGDRFETFSAAVAAFMAKIPIIHIHGGELTEGAIDDAMRHSITKFSLLHFPTTNQYRDRIIQLGEQPNRAFNTGALGIDNIKNTHLLSKLELENALGFKIDKKIVLVTFHPVTMENNTSETQFKALLSALDVFKDIKIVFTKPNADMDGKVIARLIDSYVKNNPAKAKSFISLGRLRYLSLMSHCSLVLGNSSSGIIETPSFKKPTVNIGDRQRGRIMADNIISCAPSKFEIIKAIKKALSEDFIKSCRKVSSPYGNGKAAEKIYTILKKQIKIIKDTKKSFYNIRIKK